MANLPVEREARRRPSWWSLLMAALLVAGSGPAVWVQLRAPATVAAEEEAVAPTTTVDPAAVGLRRLDADSALDFEDETLGSVGFRTGATVIVVSGTTIVVAELDADQVGFVEAPQLGQLVSPLDYLGRSVALVETTAGRFSVDAGGTVAEQGRAEPLPGEPQGELEALCDAPCDRLVVRPVEGGSWVAEFGGALATDVPVPVISPGGRAVAAWIDGDRGLRLEIASASESNVVPFSHEGTGRPVMTSWVPEGDGVAYARSGESRLQIFSPSRWATGTIWLDVAIDGAAVLPARPASR